MRTARGLGNWLLCLGPGALSLSSTGIIRKRKVSAAESRIFKLLGKQVRMPPQQIQSVAMFRIDTDGRALTAGNDKSDLAKLFRSQGYFDPLRLAFRGAGGDLSGYITRSNRGCTCRGWSTSGSDCPRICIGMQSDFCGQQSRFFHRKIIRIDCGICRIRRS
ncbi:hypothetical protein IT41_13665 [Paracoccus halophilus]|uniref:Uncharacterized protein n=1 Tax=Paracoccus halophilus TaxID=376733 RepID=A0A099EZU6_9RHOB|nr:hypothetical protein IT41_13665 [Paracoccus halophilus]